MTVRRLLLFRGPPLRLVLLAALVARRHLADDPVRAFWLAWRVLPGRTRALLRLAGPYGRAVTRWGTGDHDAALASLAAHPRRQAAFALAVARTSAAAAALRNIPESDPALPVLRARLAWQEGRLTAAVQALDGAPGRRARRLQATFRSELLLRTGQLAGRPIGQATPVRVGAGEPAAYKERAKRA
ncbi:MAG: hypothetical protein ACM32E_14125, partial [Gemmatimonadota bacterium]